MGSQAEGGIESGHGVKPAVEAEDVFVEISL